MKLIVNNDIVMQRGRVDTGLGADINPGNLVFTIWFSWEMLNVYLISLGGIWKSAQICHRRFISFQSDINALLGRFETGSPESLN